MQQRAVWALNLFHKNSLLEAARLSAGGVACGQGWSPASPRECQYTVKVLAPDVWGEGSGSQWVTMLGQSPHLIGGILWIQNPMRGMSEACFPRIECNQLSRLRGLLQSFVCVFPHAGMFGMTFRSACIAKIRFFMWDVCVHSHVCVLSDLNPSLLFSLV